MSCKMDTDSIVRQVRALGRYPSPKDPSEAKLAVQFMKSRRRRLFSKQQVDELHAIKAAELHKMKAADLRFKASMVMNGIRALGKIPSQAAGVSQYEKRLSYKFHQYRRNGGFTPEQVQEFNFIKNETIMQDIRIFGRLPLRVRRNPKERNLADKLQRLLKSKSLSPVHRAELASLSEGAFSSEVLRPAEISISGTDDLTRKAQTLSQKCVITKRRMADMMKCPYAFRIRKQDVERHGFTHGCLACSEFVELRRRSHAHSVQCRARFAKLLKDEPHFKKVAEERAEFQRLRKTKPFMQTHSLISDLQSLGRIPAKVKGNSFAEKQERRLCETLKRWLERDMLSPSQVQAVRAVKANHLWKFGCLPRWARSHPKL